MSGVSSSFSNQSNVNEFKSAANSVGAAVGKAGEVAAEKSGAEEVQQKGKGGEAKDLSSVSKAGKAAANIGIWDEKPPMNKIDMKKLEEALNNILKEPQAVVEEIRSSKGPERDNKLLHFGEKLDSMSGKELKTMRDYIGKEMASPKNNDDPLLGSMLTMVNKELDSRDQKPSIFQDPFGHGKIPNIDPGFSIDKDPFHKGPNKIDPGFSIDKNPIENLKKHIELGEKFPPKMEIQPYFDPNIILKENIDPGIFQKTPENFKNIDKGMIVDIPNKNIEYK